MKKTSEFEAYKTISALVLVLLIVFYFTKAFFALFIAIELLVINIIYVDLNRILSFYWLEFAKFLGRLNSKILLSVIFFGVLTPIAFLYRLFNPAKTKKFTADTFDSYFEDVNKQIEAKDLIKQW